MENMIRAGNKNEIHCQSGKWVIIDIGFANNASSCGLLIDDQAPVEVKFYDATSMICKYISKQSQPINLIIEAPLSVAFDKDGNPKGRSIEKHNGKIRYWYLCPGCTTMVAALYLIRFIVQSKPESEVRLFEGFVSFKDSTKKSNHSKDVIMLREVVENPLMFSDSIISPAGLKMDESDILQSAFLVAGIDAGVPPVIMIYA
ncbi:MAG: hypothetical protein EFT35_09035 [Methanophagales archaeon ANME-1-THS]|nr:MAG: hypothetical protein EFT35_09035 [Methanophagales archaeon ANME-1-THS]